jgi:hypothetical protein
LASSIDPVVLVDTTKDDEEYRAQASASVLESSENAVSSPTSQSPTAKHDHASLFESSASKSAAAAPKEQPVNKLLKNLTTMQSPRELTCVQFGERSPTLAVGDNQGTVMVYRVIHPTTITHEGPLQQTLKLKSAIAKQVDPSTSIKLTALDNPNMHRDDSNSPTLVSEMPPPPPGIVAE